MIQHTFFLKHLLIIIVLSTLFLSPSAGAVDMSRLIMAEKKGDRGMLAPYVHHRNGLGYLYTSYIFDTLLSQDNEGKPAPGLSRSWTISEDGLVYDFKIDPKAFWHDGKKLTAEDVAFTVRYMKTHPYTLTSVNHVDKAEALSADHARITLKTYNAGMITNWLISTPILPRHVYESVERPEMFSRKEAATGSGPYKLASYDKTQGRYILERNDSYYRGKPIYKTLVITKLSPVAAIKAIDTGKVDLFNQLPLGKVKDAEKKGLTVFKYYSNHPSRLKFNHRGMFREKSMRHAIAYAIDRKSLVDVAYPGGKAIVADTGWFQKGTKWYTEQNDPTYAYDKEKARALFDQNGWKLGDNGKWTSNGKPVQLRFVTIKMFKKLATALSEQLNAFGIGTDLRILEKAALQEQFRKDAFDISVVTTSTNGDPNSAIRRIFSKAPKSDEYGLDSEIKKLLDIQAASKTIEERKRFVAQFQAKYAEQLPSYILVSPFYAVAHNKNVTPVFMKTGIAFGIPMAIPKNMFIPL